MKETPSGTPVGVDDPYDHVGVCDHLTDDGKCRYAFEHPEQDPEFARERREDDLRCPVANPDGEASCASNASSAEQRSADSRVARDASRPSDRARSAEQRSADHSSGRGPREDGERREQTATPRDDGGTASGDWDWESCPHFRCRNRDRECIRCGLDERRMAHSDERPLLEEHHLSYAGELCSPSNRTQSDDAGGGETLSHEITVYLCRWCHAKVHKSWARVDDDVNPDPEAIAEKEGRRSREQSETAFESAADRFDLDG